MAEPSTPRSPDSLALGDVLRIADRVGIDVAVAAARADGRGPVLDHRAQEPWPGASLYKTLAALALVREAESALSSQVTVTDADRVPGGAGLSLLGDPVTLSWRDLMRSMLVGSDNTAAQVILRRVGVRAVDEVAGAAGMTGTRLGTAAQTIATTVAARRGEDGPAGTDRDDALLARAASDAVLGSTTTAADQLRLLQALWQGRLATPGGTDLVLGAMRNLVQRGRIASAFDHPGVHVAGRTGTWGPFRHESALIMHEGEVPIAVCVLTESLEIGRLLPAVDDGIGEIAAAVVGELRSIL
ncbi:serine hydrolase [Brachybacterium hainanense]|uniref:Serine hydrolase n=1 Tax=Brachybacterium hainanense TaxID=1541174 RepID=A0ABV6RD07_9MICO